MNSNQNHNMRPKECSTKYLESLEQKGSVDDACDFSFEDFMRELSTRRSNLRDLKALRASRLEKKMADKMERVAHHASYSGDVRKFGKNK